MTEMPYAMLRDLVLKKNNKLYFEFKDIDSERSSEKVLYSYLLRDSEEIEYLIITQSKCMDTFFTIEVYCTSADLYSIVYDRIKSFFHDKSNNANIFLCDYSGKFVDFLITCTNANIDNIGRCRSFIFDQTNWFSCVELPDGINIVKFNDKEECIDAHINELFEQLPSWKMHIGKCVNALGKDSDALYIINRNHSPIGFLSSFVCDNKKYRDVALIVISKKYRCQGLGTMLSKYYIADCLGKNCTPLYTQAENVASERVAQKSGFIYAYSMTSADILNL